MFSEVNVLRDLCVYRENTENNAHNAHDERQTIHCSQTIRGEVDCFEFLCMTIVCLFRTEHKRHYDLELHEDLMPRQRRECFHIDYALNHLSHPFCCKGPE
jgi:hypothetical protein